MAKPSGFLQSFRQNVDHSAEIAADMKRCDSEMSETVSRSEAILADSHELIDIINKLLLVR